jgi:hypothetical protein
MTQIITLVIWLMTYIMALLQQQSSRDSSVGIRTGYGLDSWGSIPGRGKFSLFSIVSRLALGPTQPPIQWVLGTLSPGVKRPGRQADHSPPSSAKVKNGGATPPLPHVFMA